jgi:hypothetical protein
MAPYATPKEELYVSKASPVRSMAFSIGVTSGDLQPTCPHRHNCALALRAEDPVEPQRRTLSAARACGSTGLPGDG